MRYVKAGDILPEELLLELQRYVDGAYLYVPRKQENAPTARRRPPGATVRYTAAIWRASVRPLLPGIIS